MAKKLTPEEEDDVVCVCGDTISQHIDGCEECVVPECGCTEFEEYDDTEDDE